MSSNTERNIKLIWEFRGPNSQKTAEHHIIHLKEYCQAKKIPSIEIALETINEMYAIAYMIVKESYMNQTRSDLKPHRGQVAE